MQYFISSSNRDVFFPEKGEYYPASHLFTQTELNRLGRTRSTFIPLFVSRNKTFISFATRHIVAFEGSETVRVIYENGLYQKYEYQIGTPWYELVEQFRKEICKQKTKVDRIEVIYA